jgi:hypothetical protein
MCAIKLKDRTFVLIPLVTWHLQLWNNMNLIHSHFIQKSDLWHVMYCLPFSVGVTILMEPLVLSRSKSYFTVTFCIELSGWELKNSDVHGRNDEIAPWLKKQVTKVILFFEISKHLNLFQYKTATPGPRRGRFMTSRVLPCFCQLRSFLPASLAYINRPKALTNLKF